MTRTDVTTIASLILKMLTGFKNRVFRLIRLITKKNSVGHIALGGQYLGIDAGQFGFRLGGKAKIKISI